jgi:folate-binding protein YgfZ
MKMENSEWHAWKPAAWLRISGADALTFLQGQFSNDLGGLRAKANGVVYGLWLNRKGRVLGDSFVLKSAGEEFWVGSYFSAATEIKARLEAFVIADDVMVEARTADWSAVTVFGDKGPPPALDAATGIQCFPGRRWEGACSEWVFPTVFEPQVRAWLADERELDNAEMERRRIAAGIPAVPADIGPGELPNEGDLDAVAISHTKGCYLGQEVIARLRSLGQVRRRLFVVRGSECIPARPALLYQRGRQVGELRSSVSDGAGFIGLALLNLLNLQPEAALSHAPEAAATVAIGKGA